MSSKEKIFEDSESLSELNNDSPIFIPTESYIKGYLKSIKLEYSFTGTIFTSKKLVVEKSATMKGDAICENILLEGNMDGNIFCSGHVEFVEGSVFNGKIYTYTFKNLTQENSDFVVQIPNNKTLSAIKTIIGELSTEVGLTSDEILSKIRNLFYENVFSARKNPHEVIVNPFTEQLNKGGKKVTKKFTPPINSVLELDDKKTREPQNNNLYTKLSYKFKYLIL